MHIHLLFGNNTSYIVSQRCVWREWCANAKLFPWSLLDQSDLYSSMLLRILGAARWSCSWGHWIPAWRCLLYSDVMGVDMVHNACISSVFPLPWVKPPLLFKDRINVCSRTKSELRPASTGCCGGSHGNPWKTCHVHQGVWCRVGTSLGGRNMPISGSCRALGRKILADSPTLRARASSKILYDLLWSELGLSPASSDS